MKKRNFVISLFIFMMDNERENPDTKTDHLNNGFCCEDQSFVFDEGYSYDDPYKESILKKCFESSLISCLIFSFFLDEIIRIFFFFSSLIDFIEKITTDFLRINEKEFVEVFFHCIGNEIDLASEECNP